jgi:hypothetical protein
MKFEEANCAIKVTASRDALFIVGMFVFNLAVHENKSGLVPAPKQSPLAFKIKCGAESAIVSFYFSYYIT